MPRQSTVKYVYTHIHELSGPYLVPFISSSDRSADAIHCRRRFSPLFPFLFSLFFIFRFSYKINQYVLAFWANSMRIDHVQTIKHVPHSVYIISLYIYISSARSRSVSCSTGNRQIRRNPALVIFLPVTNPSTHAHTWTHITNTCMFGYANGNALRAYKSRLMTNCELVYIILHICILYIWCHCLLQTRR